MLHRSLLAILSLPSRYAVPADSLASGSSAKSRAFIPGYSFGDPALARSPVTLDDFELLKRTVLFTDEDVMYLRKAGELLVSQREAILDVWYGFVGSNPHLVSYFASKDGQPIAEYLARVRARFGQWIKDTTEANYDQAWLDYQHEIGLRHTRVGKNKADNVAAVDHIHFRYLVAFIVPISVTIEPFLRKGDQSDEDVKKMHAAWTKAVVLQTILWCHPYVKDGDF